MADELSPAAKASGATPTLSDQVKADPQAMGFFRGLIAFARSVREKLDSLAGFNDPLDAAVTWRTLSNLGLVEVNGQGRRVWQGGVRRIGNTTVGAVNGVSDSTPPPAAESVTCTGGFAELFVQWVVPSSRVGVSYAEVWRNSTDSLTGATMIGTTTGTLYADSVGATQVTRYYWVRLVSSAGIIGPYNAVAGTSGTTAQDPAFIIPLIAASVTESELATALRSRVNIVDGADSGSTIAGDIAGGVLEAVRKLRAENSGLERSVEDAYERIVHALVKIQEHDETFRSAGIDVDPATGHVTIYAVDQLRDEFNTTRSDVSIELDAINSTLTLKASTDYVNEAILTAAIDPSQIAALGDIYARLDAAELDIDGNTASIALKANTTVVDGIDDRLTTAEGEIVTQAGQIALKASSTDLTTLTGRVTTAETTLSGIDGAQITRSASDVLNINKTVESEAELTLSELMRASTSEARLSVLSSVYKEEIIAKVNTDITAEAAARALLAVTVEDNTAAISTESTTRASADSAMASQISTLVSDVAGNTAAISTEASTRASADSAISSTVSTLSTTVSGHTTSIQVAEETIDGLSGKYTVKIDNNGHVSGFGLASTANNGTPTSEFIVAADRFAIVDPADTGTATRKVPFIVDGGVVYIDVALIKSASISSAKIGSVNADTITAGTLSVDRLAANSVTAAKIDSRSLSIKAADGTVILDAGTPLTASYITPSSGWLNSNVSIAANGTLSGAGGGAVTFTGLGGGALGTQAEINSSNYATYIKYLSADTITAGTLNVDRINAGTIVTAKLEDNAVTTATNGSNSSVTGSTEFNLLGSGVSVSATTADSTQKILILFTCRATTGTTGYVEHTVRVRLSSTSGTVVTYTTGSTYAPSGNGWVSLSCNTMYSPGAAGTYTFYVTGASGTTSTYQNVDLNAIVVKR